MKAIGDILNRLNLRYRIHVGDTIEKKLDNKFIITFEVTEVFDNQPQWFKARIVDVVELPEPKVRIGCGPRGRVKR